MKDSRGFWKNLYKKTYISPLLFGRKKISLSCSSTTRVSSSWLDTKLSFVSLHASLTHLRSPPSLSTTSMLLLDFAFTPHPIGIAPFVLSFDFIAIKFPFLFWLVQLKPWFSFFNSSCNNNRHKQIPSYLLGNDYDILEVITTTPHKCRSPQKLFCLFSHFLL